MIIFSDDNSLEIVDSFNDKRIKVFKSEKFINLYHARNEAIQKPKGKYICFLDTDDLWREKKLKIQVDFLKIKSTLQWFIQIIIQLKDKIKLKYIQNNYNLPSGQITKKLLKEYFIGIGTACN